MFNRLIAFILPYFPERFVWIFSRKYIAGKKLSEAIQCIEKLKEEKILPTVDVLGESISNREEAEQHLERYLHTIDTLVEKKLKGGISVKPTMFGLLWDKEFCYQHIRKITAHAAEKGIFVRIDMEDSGCTTDELELFKKLYAEFPARVGIVLQAYLKRTLSDIEFLKELSIPEHPVNIRLCKGIYIESKKIAYRGTQEIRNNYMLCLEKMLEYKFYPALATHDKKLIYSCIDLIQSHGLNRDQYEFQMLLGVAPRLRKELIEKGHKMRVYVPYGDMWFKYATRRLQENPAMVWDIITGIVVPR